MRFAGSRGKRARWLALFTTLLLGISAIPVLADAPPSEPPVEEPTSPDAEAQALPDGSDVGEALREAEKREEEEQLWLESDEAEREREESQDAYAEASPSEAAELLEASFADPLAMLEQDPARALTDAEIDQFLSLTAARITVGGETMLMEGSIPLRVPDESGDLSKVSLDLVESEGGFVPENPLVDVTLPRQASEGIAVGDSGLTVAPEQSAGDSVARRFGDKDLLYPETQTDTSLLASPISDGVELFSELLSEESPEELRFDLSLPEGAGLHPDGRGGAEVSEREQQIAAIPAPTAIDAQGADIPVQMHVEGDSLVLHIAHRGMDVAYPLLVDPAISDSWYGAGNWLSGANLAALTDGTWIFKSSDWARFGYSTGSPAKGLVGGSEKGLFARANGTSSTQPAEHFAQWSYTVPGTTTWISAAGVNPFWRFNYGCSASSYPEPHDFDGLWSPTWSPQYGWISFQSEAAKSEQAIAEPPKDWREKTAQVFILGLGTGSSSTPANPCTRDLYAGGAYVWMSDPEPPTLTQPTGIPTGWISGKTQFTIKASASDPGLGVQNVTIAPSGVEIIPEQLKCTGLAANRCPPAHNAEFKLNGLPFAEGQRTATISATDALGQASNTYSFETWVDRTAPEVTLSGQLANATDEDEGDVKDPEKWDELKLPVYKLTTEAKDGSTSKAILKRSGMKSLGIFLDSKEAPEQSWSQECPLSSCKMTKSYSLKLTGLSTGKHTLKVRAEDQLGQVSERNIEFEYVPATGITDDYVMQRFPLPDGQGNEAEEEFPDRPELAVNVMNGNLVYREKDVEVNGPAVDLEVERFYNSQLPEDENTEWGDGWTLGQTPELEPKEPEGSQPPEDAKLVAKSGLLASRVALPTTTGGSHFDSSLQAVMTKTSSGYKLTDRSGATEAATVFDEGGKTQEVRTPGFARVDYEYEGGELSEIAVTDPGAAADPSGGEEEEPEYALPTPVYRSAFGSSGPGQLQSPGDVALDAAGNAWVADKGHNRIEEFDPEGKYITGFGEYGEGKGQLSRPASLAIDAEGSIWVADADNNRVEEFSESGKYLSAFGGSGEGNGEFNGPEGIAIDPTSGDIWVSDTYNGRVQRFDEDGKFIEVVGSYGSGEGEIGEATGIDVGPGGDVWIADWLNNRVEVFDESGNFVRQFGSEGTGNGEFQRPDAIDVDAQGNVWVGDQNNGRVQRFDQNGEYVDQFGSKGSGPGQFSFAYPMGIATDEKGGLWISDVNNNRIQHWEAPIAESGEAASEENDPSVEVDTSGGLVTAIEGKEAGTQTYKYSGDLPIANKGPEGETKYEYDAEGRLKKVTLPNGTVGKATYNATYGRVASVTVDPAGSAPSKITHFAYTLEPRRTTVTPPDGPVVTYDIGEDGSVVKWWNAVEPPKFEDLSGGLYFEKETEKPISAGDKTLHILAHSNEGIASIQVIANGTDLVDEETCEQDYENLETECQYVADDWVMNTNNFPPGILNLEVVITDRVEQTEHTAAERFWVNIPEPPPPPPPGAPVPPAYEDVLRFREEFGLDVVDPVSSEAELNERIFDLIGAWWSGDSIARSTAENWGVPLRTKDIEELEYRDRYLAHNVPLVEEWAEAHSASTYAGYYMDHRQGGIMHVGFTQNQESRLVELKQQLDLMASDRLGIYPVTPTISRLSLQATQEAVESALETNKTLDSLITEVGLDETSNLVQIGATDVGQGQTILSSVLGSNAPVSVTYEAEGESFAGRHHTSGRIVAGDRILNEEPKGCTAGFGTWEARTQKSTGELVVAKFLLTAGHCAHIAEKIERSPYPGFGHKSEWKTIGKVARTGEPVGGQHYETDASAVRLEASSLVPLAIYRNGEAPRPVDPAGTAKHGEILCFSGQATDAVKCGEMVGVRYRRFVDPGRHLFIIVRFAGLPGDSGAPVWNPVTGTSIGIVSGGPHDGRVKDWVTPLVVPRGFSGEDAEKVPGALQAPGMGALSVLEGQ